MRDPQLIRHDFKLIVGASRDEILEEFWYLALRITASPGLNSRNHRNTIGR